MVVHTGDVITYSTRLVTTDMYGEMAERTLSFESPELMTHHLEMTPRPKLRQICTYSVACSAEEYCGKVIVEALVDFQQARNARGMLTSRG